ncbi:L,D-transpeptidase family protein [Neotabrizicola shimadae]|uniref:L,D-transpeptidase family protein n=1 Tax=Neotabrizicola shimadae TaxID=2807096 RepID=A0A8G0ZPM0_9RHOB|nr:L,D-transpeptidase family protein [Neotabrizicola shimadae]QYZ69166.1 L,D-transpeptidase family protein [Neotabrizicola shimadae]
MAFIARIFLVMALAVGLASCAPNKFQKYDGPAVTQVQVYKADRRMYLLHNGEVLESYDIELGGNPIGPKQFEGDMKTPEGTYHISHRNPNSRYYLSLGVSYPSAEDIAFAEANGKRAGGDIMIHGTNRDKRRAEDWTAGCIAVSNKEMREIYAMVKPGTPIVIFP